MTSLQKLQKRSVDIEAARLYFTSMRKSTKIVQPHYYSYDNIGIYPGDQKPTNKPRKTFNLRNSSTSREMKHSKSSLIKPINEMYNDTFVDYYMKTDTDFNIIL